MQNQVESSSSLSEIENGITNDPSARQSNNPTIEPQATSTTPPLAPLTPVNPPPSSDLNVKSSTLDVKSSGPSSPLSPLPPVNEFHNSSLIIHNSAGNQPVSTYQPAGSRTSALSTVSLSLFTDAETLKKIDTRRTTLFLRRFASELAAAGLALPAAAADIMDDDYCQRWLSLLANPAFPPAIIETMLAIETAALPENGIAIDAALARCVPNTATFANGLDRVLELWFFAPEELHQFRSASHPAAGVIQSSPYPIPSVNPPPSSDLKVKSSALDAKSSVVNDVPSHPLPPLPPVNSPPSSDLNVKCSALDVKSSVVNDVPSPPLPPLPPVNSPPSSDLNVKSSALDVKSSVVSDVPSSPLPPLPPVKCDPENPNLHSDSSSIEHRPSKIENTTAILLNDLVALLHRFVVLPTHAAETLALWILHTWTFKLRDVSTYIGIESPQKGCGKTTLLRVLTKLVHEPVATTNVSPSALFRVIEQLQPTLLIDEGDTLANLV